MPAVPGWAADPAASRRESRKSAQRGSNPPTRFRSLAPASLPRGWARSVAGGLIAMEIPPPEARFVCMGRSAARRGAHRGQAPSASPAEFPGRCPARRATRGASRLHAGVSAWHKRPTRGCARAVASDQVGDAARCDNDAILMTGRNSLQTAPAGARLVLRRGLVRASVAMLRRCGAGLAAAAARGLRLDGGAAAPAVASASASASAAGQPPHCGACGACGALPCGCVRGTSTPVRGMATSRRVASLEKQRADARRNKPYRVRTPDACPSARPPHGAPPRGRIRPSRGGAQRGRTTRGSGRWPRGAVPCAASKRARGVCSARCPSVCTRRPRCASRACSLLHPRPPHAASDASVGAPLILRGSPGCRS